MIKNRLSILLAERNLTAAKVYEETKISKSTLSSLVNNANEGLQTKTLDTLCNFLEITPCDFFEYLDFIYEISVEYEKKDFVGYADKTFALQNYLSLTIVFKKGKNVIGFEFPLTVTNEPYDSDQWFDKSVNYFISNHGYSDQSESVANYIESMPITFKTDFTNTLAKKISSAIIEGLKEEGASFSKKNKYDFDLDFIRFQETI